MRRFVRLKQLLTVSNTNLTQPNTRMVGRWTRYINDHIDFMNYVDAGQSSSVKAAKEEEPAPEVEMKEIVNEIAEEGSQT